MMDQIKNTFGVTRGAGAMIALALTAACSGGTSGITPSNAVPSVQYRGVTAFVNGRAVAAAHPRFGTQAAYAAKLIAVPAKQNASNYEYVIGMYGTNAGIFDYPASNGQTGTIANVGG